MFQRMNFDASHQIVLGSFDRPGLPFSRKACEELAARDVWPAVVHIRQYGHIPSVTIPEYLAGGYQTFPDFNGETLDRHDPDLVNVVERLGKEAHRWNREFRIVTIQGSKYRIVKNSKNEEQVIVPAQWVVIQ